MAEELASHAEQLQHAIAFFKVDEGDHDPLEKMQQVLKSVHPITGSAQVTDKNLLRQGKTGQHQRDGERKPHSGDELDTEFEKY